jgi:hypothetical protein
MLGNFTAGDLQWKVAEDPAGDLRAARQRLADLREE